MPNAADLKEKSDRRICPPESHQGDFLTWRVRLLQAVNRFFAVAYHQVRVEGLPRLPKKGPAILACNHISGLDPLLIQGVLRRPIVWMMAREYYELPILGGVFRSIGAIPVDRSGRDMTATRSALRTLANGRVLGIFPEGKLEKSRQLLPLQPGLAMMAAKTQVPIHPIYLDGTNRGLEMLPAVLMPNEATVRFGNTITSHLVDKPNLDRLSTEVYGKMLSLWNKGA